MKTIESVQPTDSMIEEVKAILEEDGPLSHEEIVELSSLSSSHVQRTANLLWREGIVYHTVDRRLDIEPGEEVDGRNGE